MGLIAELECLSVSSDTAARVVVNERTGTVIIGGDVRILPVAIAHGSLKITVSSGYQVSQPGPFTGGTTVVEEKTTSQEAKEERGSGPEGQAVASGVAAKRQPVVPRLPGARTVVTPKTELKVEEEDARLVEIQPQTRLRDLVEALNALGVKPRDLIAILQALKAANALQAELVLM